MKVLGVDIGGSGIKGALVNVKTGKMITNRVRLPTPRSRLPKDVLPVVKKVIDSFDYDGPVGVGFPAVVVDGVPQTPFTAHHIQEWVGYKVEKKLSKLTGRSVTVLNDADAAGIAEMAFGAGRGQKGTVVLLTLGTGIGSGLFYNGKLLPNTELGGIYLKGQDEFAERFAADSARSRHDLSWSEWAERLDHYLHQVAHIVRPRMIILGGGVSKKHDLYLPYLTIKVPVVPAKLRNQAGFVGAALAAIDR